MQPILVAYATTEGHTRKVAEFVAEQLRIRGHPVDLVDAAAATAQDISPVYRAAFIGGSIHQHRHQSALLHFVKRNRDWLSALPVGLFSVSLSAALEGMDGQLEARRMANEFIDECGVRPLVTCCVAGALKYVQYDYFKRLLMRMTAKQRGGTTDTEHDHEFTRWDEVETFVDEVLAAGHIARSAPSAAA